MNCSKDRDPFCLVWYTLKDFLLPKELLSQVLFYYNYSNINHVAFQVEGNEIKGKTCILKIVLLFRHITNPINETHSEGI
jgi:hypothetical protein